MADAVVIGAGLFGQVIAKGLRAQGRDVVVLDDQRENAGSRPAACLMKPSWFSSMGKDIHEPSLKLLDELYGVQDVKFGLRPMKSGGRLGSATVHWIPPGIILDPPVITENAHRVEPGVVHTTTRDWEAPLVVVAAGIWTERLLQQYKQQGQKGVAFLWRDRQIEEPFIRPWAPYRQLVAFNRGDGLWMGDGTAIKQENWTTDRENMSWQRAAGALNRLGHGDLEKGRAEALVGVRPYAKAHKPCLLAEVAPGLWVASGGAKNGTVAAGYCAHMIRERTS